MINAWNGEICKSYCYILRSAPGICLIVNFGAKIKIPLKIPYLGIFELQFKNTFVIFEIKTLKFS